ncbi:uncharacterized protein [Palaemon carinicauda]|uniref:uncharacterized protein n=1 Tax=Palaemon carinicauda TaxID=392227 RepID=UPI0035B5B42A
MLVSHLHVKCIDKIAMGNKPRYQKVNVDDTSESGRDTPPVSSASAPTNPSVTNQPKGPPEEQQRFSLGSASAQLGDDPSRQGPSSAAPSEYPSGSIALSEMSSSTSVMSVRTRHSSLQSDRPTSRPVFADETFSSSLHEGSLVGPAPSQYFTAESTVAMKFIKKCKKLESPKKDAIASPKKDAVAGPSGTGSSRTSEDELQATSSTEYDEVSDLIQAKGAKKGGKNTRRVGRQPGHFDEAYTYDPRLIDPNAIVIVPWH